MNREEILEKLAAGELPVSEASRLLQQSAPVPRRGPTHAGKSEAERELYSGIRASAH
jgi:hypothetical protein